MKPGSNIATLVERFFTDRLVRRRNVSANTIASYRDTFRLLFRFAQARLRKPPSALALDDLDAPFIGAFLEDLEAKRGAGIGTRNLRLTAIRSFYRFASFEEPARSALIQRVLAIPSKRHDKRQVHFLTRPEIEAVLAAPDRTTWLGRRDHWIFRRNQPVFPIQTSCLFRAKPAGRSDDPSRADGAVCERVKLAYEATAPSSLALSARSLRMLSPFRSKRWAPCTSLSSTASAIVGLPMCSCQNSTGT